MKKNIRKPIYLILLSLFSFLLFTSCYVTSGLLPNVSLSVPIVGEPSIEVDLPHVEVHIQNQPTNSNNHNNRNNNFDNGALPTHIQFENAIKGKTWFSRITDDGSYNRVYQIKLRFNTNNKTVVKETYYWKRSGRSNSFYFEGTNVQSAKYDYTADNNKLDCKIYENYNTNNVRNNSSHKSGVYGVWYSLDNADIITWDGHQYISERALANQSVTNYTNKNSFTLIY